MFHSGMMAKCRFKDELNSRADNHKTLIRFDRLYCRSDRTVYGMPCLSNCVIAPLIKDRNDCTCRVFVRYKHCDFHFYTWWHSICNCESWDLALVLKFCNLMHKYCLNNGCNFQSYIYFTVWDIWKTIGCAFSNVLSVFHCSKLCNAVWWFISDWCYLKVRSILFLCHLL